MARRFLVKLRTKTGLSVAAVVVIFLVGWMTFGGKSEVATAAVERRTISSVVDVTGSVVPISSANLGFEEGGRVAFLPAKEGTRVFKGQILAALDSSALYADLKSAQAALQIRQAEAGNTSDSVEAVEAEQKTLVENAYRTLLSEGLEFVSVDDDETIEPPTISGRYNGKEGRYKVRIYRSAGGPTAIKVFGLEPNPQEILIPAASRAIPLDDTGLFVTFSEDPVGYQNTDWILDIPNRSSAEYPDNLAAYESAIRERDRALQEAREEASDSSAETSIAAARVAQAEADVARVQADIASRSIYAPFNGLVKSVDVEIGEIIGANTAAVVLISDGSFQIEAELPEIDSTKVREGMTAEVTIDAFGDDRKFPAKVISVDRAESLDGSVPVYKMEAYIDEPPTELRSGMTADIVISVASKENTLAVPLSAVELAADGDFVSVVRSGKEERIPVSLGLRGDDGFVEVIGSVSEGDLVVLPQR